MTFPMNFRVNIRGVPEVQAGLALLDKGMQKDLYDWIKEAAEPIAVATRGKLGAKYRGVSTRTIKVRKQGTNVFVQQDAKKVTGDRGDFGSLQMTRGFIPAAEEGHDELVSDVEQQVGGYISRLGF